MDQEQLLFIFASFFRHEFENDAVYVAEWLKEWSQSADMDCDIDEIAKLATTIGTR